MGWNWGRKVLNKDVKEVVDRPLKRRWTDTLEGQIWELNWEIDKLMAKVKEGVGI